MLVPSQCWQCKHLLPVCHLSENLVLLWIEPFNFDVLQSISFGLLPLTFEVLFKKCIPTSGLPRSSLETLQPHPNWTRQQWSIGSLLLCNFAASLALASGPRNRIQTVFYNFPQKPDQCLLYCFNIECFLASPTPSAVTLSPLSTMPFPLLLTRSGHPFKPTSSKNKQKLWCIRPSLTPSHLRCTEGTSSCECCSCPGDRCPSYMYLALGSWVNGLSRHLINTLQIQAAAKEWLLKPPKAFKKCIPSSPFPKPHPCLGLIITRSDFYNVFVPSFFLAAGAPVRAESCCKITQAHSLWV